MASEIHTSYQRRDREGILRHAGEWLTLWSDPDSMRTEEQRRRLGEQRARQLAEEARLSAAARALSGNPAFYLAPTVDVSAEAPASAFGARRGRADSAALRSRFHDPVLHAAGRPKDHHAARLYDVCERVRCECLGALRLAGVERNLVAAQLERLEKADLLNAHLAALVPITEALEMTLRDTFLEAEDTTIATSGFWMWERWLRDRLDDDFMAMKALLSDQRAYGAAAAAMIERLFVALDSRTSGERSALARRERGGESGEPGEPGEVGDEDQGGSGEKEHQLMSAEEEQPSFEPGTEIFDIVPPEEAKPPPLPPARPPPYRIFTTDYDMVLDASDLASPDRLRTLRHRLEEKRADLRRDVSRLAARLQRKLLAKQLSTWQFDLEEGLIDAARLDRVIVNPGWGLAYKEEQLAELRDTAVTLLIDNSGSMRGKPIEIACLVADMAAAALERCGVTVEILGYTTSGWRGGDAFRRWHEAGRPADPGRLNDLRHIVFKSADLSYRRARDRIAAMMEPEHLRENIDGEALLWAASRLRQRHERRKVLLVISDGAPADQATIENNADRNILDRHLRKVIGDLEEVGDLSLLAVGVKHDVTRYYRVSRVIDKADALGEAIFSALDAIFS